MDNAGVAESDFFLRIPTHPVFHLNKPGPSCICRTMDTIDIENRFSPPFFNKIPVSFERGEGVYAFDEQGRRYLDFTAGWGVTCLGHAHPVITAALEEQAGKIIQNPNSGASYSPARARLLALMPEVLPHGLRRVFFTNSGAEANDAAIKLTRKITGRMNVISTEMSFHGRTISTASATGQSSHRDRYSPLMPHYLFVPYNDASSVERLIGDDVAAVIVEPIQGEGGIIVPDDEYLPRLSALCRDNGALLILDEIQTGFCRTGVMFESSRWKLQVGFMTMAKGIAGGFPFGAFAMPEDVASKLGQGDHGGTYCGNPLGCAVSHAVIRHMIDGDICGNVNEVGSRAIAVLRGWRRDFPHVIRDVRGKGLLIALELSDGDIARDVLMKCLERGLVLNVTQKKVVRLFPALNITMKEMEEGLAILGGVLAEISAG